MLIPRVLIFITRGKSALLIKGAPTKRLWADKYNGIGGHVERGEDVLTAARRELMEETGLRTDLKLAGTLIVDAEENIGIGLYIFVGESLDGEPLPSPEGTLEWIPIPALSDYPLVEDVAILLHKIQSMHPSAPPFSARSFYNTAGKLQVEFS